MTCCLLERVASLFQLARIGTFSIGKFYSITRNICGRCEDEHVAVRLAAAEEGAVFAEMLTNLHLHCLMSALQNAF